MWWAVGKSGGRCVVVGENGKRVDVTVEFLVVEVILRGVHKNMWVCSCSRQEKCMYVMCLCWYSDWAVSSDPSKYVRQLR